MPKRLAQIDWSLIQAFLAVAEGGSLSAAARTMRQSQPTLGRQVQAIEASLGVTLFRRERRGMALTEAGAALLEPARTMLDAAGRLALIAAGEAEDMHGTVRITASVFVSHHVLPPILARLRQAAPEIALDLVASDASDNLLFREADIAVRMYRPDQLDIVARHLGDVALGLFGAKSYFDRRGRPATLDELRSHDFVGYDTSDLIIRGFRGFGWQVDRDWFAVRCDNQSANWELVRAGCGLGFAQLHTGLADPSVERVAADLPLPPLPLWLATHDRLWRTGRVRLVWTHLAEGLAPLVS